MDCVRSPVFPATQRCTALICLDDCIYINHCKHPWHISYSNCSYHTWKSDALFCELTLKVEPLNEVEFIADTPSARFRVEILMDGPVN